MQTPEGLSSRGLSTITSNKAKREIVNDYMKMQQQKAMLEANSWFKSPNKACASS